jgi:hypothetical protein
MSQKNKPTPSLITGTSSEFLGRRPLPRIVVERNVVIVMGPPRVGKSRVARRLATLIDDAVQVMDTHDLDAALVERIRTGAWAPSIEGNEALVVDGPVWLRNRPSVVRLLVELATGRAEAGRRTVFCQRMADGSAEELMGALPPGSSVVIGLRFPKGRTSRLSIARRRCEELGVPMERAVRSHDITPWTYDALDEYLSGGEGADAG